MDCERGPSDGSNLIPISAKQYRLAKNEKWNTMLQRKIDTCSKLIYIAPRHYDKLSSLLIGPAFSPTRTPFRTWICSLTLLLLVPPFAVRNSTLFSKSKIKSDPSRLSTDWRSSCDNLSMGRLRASASATTCPLIWWVSRKGTPLRTR